MRYCEGSSANFGLPIYVIMACEVCGATHRIGRATDVTHERWLKWCEAISRGRGGLSSPDAREVASLYTTGSTLGDLERRFGVGMGRIRGLLCEQGVTLRARSETCETCGRLHRVGHGLLSHEDWLTWRTRITDARRARRVTTPELEREIAELYEMGLSFVELESLYNVSRGGMQRILDRQGVSKRRGRRTVRMTLQAARLITKREYEVGSELGRALSDHYRVEVRRW